MASSTPNKSLTNASTSGFNFSGVSLPNFNLERSLGGLSSNMPRVGRPLFGDEEQPSEFDGPTGPGEPLARSAGAEGDLNYDALHPPYPDVSGITHESLANPVLTAPSGTAAIGEIGDYWATEMGHQETWSDNQQSEFGTGYNYAFGANVDSWRTEWGDDNPFSSEQADWRTHGGERQLLVDLPYMTEVENKLKEMEVSIGYNADNDLIEQVYPGYSQGAEVNVAPLEERYQNPEIVMQELVKSDSASGAWGSYLREDENLEVNYERDKDDARESLRFDERSLDTQKKAITSAARGDFRGIGEARGMGGLRRGGRRAGGYTRGDADSVRSRISELGVLREQARSSYDRKLERLQTQKDYAAETNENTLKTKIENEFLGLAGDVESAGVTYQSESFELEEENAGAIHDMLGIFEDTNQDWPWPGKTQ